MEALPPLLPKPGSEPLPIDGLHRTQSIWLLLSQNMLPPFCKILFSSPLPFFSVPFLPILKEFYEAHLTTDDVTLSLTMVKTPFSVGTVGRRKGQIHNGKRDIPGEERGVLVSS